MGRKGKGLTAFPLVPSPPVLALRRATASQRAGQEQGACSSKEWEEQSLWEPAAGDREWDQVGDRRQVTFTPLGTGPVYATSHSVHHPAGSMGTAHSMDNTRQRHILLRSVLAALDRAQADTHSPPVSL